MNLKSMHLRQGVKPMRDLEGTSGAGLNFSWPQAIAKENTGTVCRNCPDYFQFGGF